jgi:Fic family protein
MYANPSAMEPLLPDQTGPLADLAVQIYTISATAAGHVHPVVFQELRELLRVVNSYYSNLIEGNATHPVDVIRAMGHRFAEDPAKRAKQQESVAHVEVQRLAERRLLDEPDLAVTSPDFLIWLHQQFYERLPLELRLIEDPKSKEPIEVVPGALRERQVGVGSHIGPNAGELKRFLNRFHEVFDPSGLHGHDRLIAAAAAHHRLLWIHPFLDGNGRVARLFTDAYLRRAGVDGYGLWTVSRGLARNSASYRQMLAAADAPREGALDGRENLSMKRLRHWCEWFLGTCVDQARYMSGLMRLDGLRHRMDAYVRLRVDGVALGPDGSPDPLRPESRMLLLHTLVASEVPRGEFAALSGRAERTVRLALAQLSREGLLRSDSPKGPVRLGFPPHTLPYLFPELVPSATT